MSKDKEANDREEYRKLRDGIPPGMVCTLVAPSLRG